MLRVKIWRSMKGPMTSLSTSVFQVPPWPTPTAVVRDRVSSFEGLKGEDFRHPLDQQNTSMLRSIPGLEVIAKSFIGQNMRIRHACLPFVMQVYRHAIMVVQSTITMEVCMFTCRPSSWASAPTRKHCHVHQDWAWPALICPQAAHRGGASAWNDPPGALCTTGKWNSARAPSVYTSLDMYWVLTPVYE